MEDKKKAPEGELIKNNMRNDVVDLLWRFIDSALILSAAILIWTAPKFAIIPAIFLFISASISILGLLRRKQN